MRKYPANSFGENPGKICVNLHMNFWKIQREKNTRYSVKFDSRGENIAALKQMQTTSGCIFYNKRRLSFEL